MSTLRRPLPALILLCGVLSACSVDGGDTRTIDKPPPTLAAAAPEWSYSGARSAAHWGESYPDCAPSATGTQSPIDIEHLSLGDSHGAAPVELDLRPARFALVNNGHTIEAIPEKAAAGGFRIGGVTYTVEQFHLHAPSEHLIDGAPAAMELHVVARSADGATAVLGLLMAEGRDSDVLDELFASMPTGVTGDEEAITLDEPIDLGALMPPDAPLARYVGSLTTPPCTEGVLWDVYLSEATVSSDQLAAFHALYPDNHRPVQSLHGRQVEAVQGVRVPRG